MSEKQHLVAARSIRQNLRIDQERLSARLEALAAKGARDDGGCNRLAFTEADREGRALVVSWMRELGLTVVVDQIGNVVGSRPGIEPTPPVMVGSHIDTVRTGGRFDGNLGVLAGLEIVESLNAAHITTTRPLSVAFFSNEEGARFAPDMMGSLVYAGGLSVDDAYAAVGIDGVSVKEALESIDYIGTTSCPGPAPHAYVELHIEQGPLLEAEGIDIGAVTGVQGISWQEVTIGGQANHAGTTPMSYRHDAGYAAAACASFVRRLTLEMGGAQVGTVGAIELDPNLINVVARHARMTVDLRNTDEALLQQAESRFADFLEGLARDEGVQIDRRFLARFEPVDFDERVISLVEDTARSLGHRVRRLPAGAGHDAQMLQRICPAGMVFTPSVKGISHNPKEFTAEADLEAGANVLLQVVLALTENPSIPSTLEAS